MSFAAYAPPVAESSPSARSEYFRKVGALTFAGLVVAAGTSVISSLFLAATPVLLSRWPSLILIMGSFYMANSGMRGLVYSESQGTKLAGFFGASVFQGIAMGYLLLAAAIAGEATFGNPFIFLVEAGALVGLIAVGMLVYLAPGPKDLSMVRGAMTMAALPMLALMAISWVFPIGGTLGLIVSLAFVAMSVGGLLYKLDQVVHTLPTTMWVEGAYSVTMGLLVLFWNLMNLLMRAQRR